MVRILNSDFPLRRRTTEADPGCDLQIYSHDRKRKQVTTVVQIHFMCATLMVDWATQLHTICTTPSAYSKNIWKPISSMRWVLGRTDSEGALDRYE